jgi:hypothetical protein
MADKVIKVDYDLYASSYTIRNKLPKLLESFKLLSFDTETRSVYNQELRKEATGYLKTVNTSDTLYKHARLVAASSGLSYPSITRTTHFVFGESKSKSHVVICNTPELEMFVWQLISKYEGKLLVHNSLFDLKIMFHRMGLVPPDFDDTALIVKCLINHVNIWKCKTGLKELMGQYYSPKWTLMNDYEPANFRDPAFLEYAAIDGASTYYLWEQVQEELNNDN